MHTQGEQTRQFIENKWWARQDLNLGPTDYESAALTAELRALREATLDFIMIWNNCEAAISGDGTARALGYNRAHGNALRSLQCANDLQPGGKLLVHRASTRSDADGGWWLSVPRLSFKRS